MPRIASLLLAALLLAALIAAPAGGQNEGTPRERLSEVREKLSGLLRERYMGDRPDFVTVVLHADGFPQLLETLSFMRRVERADTRLLGVVRAARSEADGEQKRYVALAERREREAKAVRARRDALAGITAGLRERRELLRRAHAARLAA